MSRSQATIGSTAEWSGVGIHTGGQARLTARPAPAGHGRVFRCPQGSVRAGCAQVVDCTRSTRLREGEVTVSTVEHLLAAASALALDNLIFELEGEEIPILDGSSLDFAKSLAEAGRQEQEETVRPLELKRPVWVSQGDSLCLARPHHQLELEYVLDYPYPMLGCQSVVFVPDQDSFLEQLAPARTFALWEEVQPLLESGLAKGGDLENALVVYQDRFSTPLRIANEPVRHKCLDLLGDLALLERPLLARVTAVKAGHRLHVALAQKIAEETDYA